MQQYSFNEMLKMSNGVSKSQAIEEIILQNVIGAVNVYKAHEANDRNGTDYWVEHVNGKHLSVDVKIRQQDFSLRGEDDLALETWSVVGKKVGWTRDSTKKTDFVLWYWDDTGRWVMLPFLMLCSVFAKKWSEWHREYKTAVQSTPENGGYRSECVFVPRKVVWTEIYRQYGGAGY